MKTIDPGNLPMLLRVKSAEEVSGLSRSEIYRRIGSGQLVAKKNRKTTYILTESLLDNVYAMAGYGD
jgi:hypothetical protein